MQLKFPNKTASSPNKNCISKYLEELQGKVEK